MKGLSKYLLVLLFITGIFSCETPEFIDDPDATLNFSVDTVYFDTIFTTIGSVTNQLRVYNPYDQPVKVRSIYLAGGDQSVFRLNIDGISANRADNVEIQAKDSIYIFVEVTLDPNNADSLLVIQDSIVFITNGNIQDVDLVAWGQDVHLINGEIVETDRWINDKPYLIFNSMLVDTNQVLTIDEGVRLYFHRNSRLYVAGTLVVNGTLDDPVTFQGDRLEQLYKDIPAQWDGIYLLPGSKRSIINFAIIQNAIIGIQADTMGAVSDPTLRISNSIIKNMSAAGIYGRGTTITADNCVVADCGIYAVALIIGGSYEFYHCTIANYWGSLRNQTTPALVLNNYYEDIYGRIQIREIDKAYFGNCIIYGDKESEFKIAQYPDTKLEYFFDHCVVKIDPEEFELDNEDHFRNILDNEDPKFISYDNNDYQLDTLSSAKDKASADIANLFPVDLNGISRLGDDGPDIGAYERVEGDTIQN